MDEKMKSVITCDLDGKLETFSEGAEKLFGYTSDEIIGKGRVSDFSDGQIVLGHVVNWLKEAVEKGAWEGDTVFLHKDGSEMPCHIKITPTKDKNNNQIIKKLINTKKVRKKILLLKQDINKPDFGRF
mgnify:CR=1 FL=1